jgi:GTP cyclohydrolase I
MGNFDRDRITAAIREVLFAIGEDPDRDELAATPSRVADAYAEFFGGVGADAAAHLAQTFPVSAPPVSALTGQASANEPVLVRGIAFRSICEHHLLPFIGTAHVAYIPSDRIAGLGRLAQVIDTLATRPQLQERLTEQIADTIDAALAPNGVLVVLEARHGCIATRGSRQVDSSVVTIASRGTLSSPAARAELMGLIGSAFVDGAGL